mmetsp:Transcript_7913/g.9072  ORF Transcript_7913/g.9072 Transcript_7913/m.9072 type:complete len:112 (-) Transcript_7913:147-482(-)
MFLSKMLVIAAKSEAFLLQLESFGRGCDPKSRHFIIEPFSSSILQDTSKLVQVSMVEFETDENEREESVSLKEENNISEASVKHSKVRSIAKAKLSSPEFIFVDNIFMSLE